MKKLLLILAIIATTATAQEISYGEYMQRVMDGNIALTAKRFDIEIADARLVGSKTHNDPTLAITYSSNENWSKKLGDAIEGELSRTFTFGVRKSRIRLSESEQAETTALLEEYIRNFQPPVDGGEIMRLFGLPPCDTIGTLKNSVKDAILDGIIPNEHDAALAYVIEKAAKMGITPQTND